MEARAAGAVYLTVGRVEGGRIEAGSWEPVAKEGAAAVGGQVRRRGRLCAGAHVEIDAVDLPCNGLLQPGHEGAPAGLVVGSWGYVLRKVFGIHDVL